MVQRPPAQTRLLLPSHLLPGDLLLYDASETTECDYLLLAVP